MEDGRTAPTGGVVEGVFDARARSRKGSRGPFGVLTLAAIAAAAAFLVVLLALGGLDYYRTSYRVRAYAPAHRTLRPAGPVGRSLGVAGAVLMFGGTLAYVARKRLRVLANAGSTKAWLEVHIFCGLLGPALVTLHTSFRFNGIVSVAYWSMLGVVASGFIGRYLYVRIPRTLRGVEMDRAAIEARALELRRELADMTVPLRLLLRIEEMERDFLPPEGTRPGLGSLVFGGHAVRKRKRAIEREIRSAGLDPRLLREALHAEAERINLLRRAASLDLTRRLFALWHVFHRPFVWVLVAVFVLHVGVAIYFGYAAGGR
jgi:hypothetical protein